MKRKYYEAYDDRYRQVHGQNLKWFCESPSPIVAQTIDKYAIAPTQKLLEIGCGEGRDAFALLKQGYKLLATDISPAAIHYCNGKLPEYTDSFALLDCVTGDLEVKFDFIFAVAVVHMLVEDEDRNCFYSFIRNYLSPNGIALICTMGDGETQLKTDPKSAFDLQDRIHEQSGKHVQIASTSCRMVSFPEFHNELKRNGLRVLEEGFTSIEPDFPSMMYAVVSEE